MLLWLAVSQIGHKGLHRGSSHNRFNFFTFADVEWAVVLPCVFRQLAFNVFVPSAIDDFREFICLLSGDLFVGQNFVAANRLIPNLVVNGSVFDERFALNTNKV